MGITRTSLALKFRPSTFTDVVEQDAIKTILAGELAEGNLKRCLLFTGPAGTGKCLGKDTPILMYDGTIKLVQDIQVGDQLMGPDSKPRNVLSLARGQETMYKVIPTRGGNSFTCNESHILSLKCSYTSGHSKKYVKDKVFNLSIKEFLKIGKSTREKILRLYRVAVDFPNQQPLEIDPYIYGLWLGDGTCGKAELSNTDKEIVESWCNYGQSLGMKLNIYDEDRCPRYAFTNGWSGGKPNELKNFFDKSLVTGHKRILQEYKTASRENRLKLLAGIIDTDGHKVVKTNTIEITTKYEDLAEDYAFVCRSLGFRTSVTKKEHCKLDGKYHQAYTVRFSGELSSIPCKVKRKQCTEPFKDGDPLKTSFKLENIGLGDYYGFTIDGDHLFMLGDFTVTHNTTNARIFANDIEKTATNIIEINCADHTGVDDVRRLIIEPSRVKPLCGDYKIFILDEVHMLTVQSQNALLKVLEEPPAYCIYIMCTTDPQKILSTILSRAFRYDFQLISQKGIVDRLDYILTNEKNDPNGCGVQSWDKDALNLIAVNARGHLRDAITNTDKILSFTKNITIEDVEKVLGMTGYDILFNILDCLLSKYQDGLIQSINNLVNSGMDLKLFVKNFLSFVLDVNKYVILKTENIQNPLDLIDIPSSYENKLNQYNASHKPALKQLLKTLIELNSSLKWETNVKPVLETQLLLEVL